MGAYGSPDTFPYDKMEKKCPKCGKMVEGKFCPECGARLYKEKKKLGIKQVTTQSGNVIILRFSVLALDWGQLAHLVEESLIHIIC